MIRLLSIVLLQAALLPATGLAAARDYGLQPRQVAPGTYVIEGRNEDFSFSNGGNILNTGFIVTSAGVVVINTGPSQQYGRQLRAAIAAVTERPVVRVYISKLHPDHFLGNQAFRDVPIAAAAATIEGIRQQGEQFTDNMYRLCGAWMRGTEPVVPDTPVDSGRIAIGGHELELMVMAGHTPGDLVILDRTTGVLFAGGVVFHDRAPTTPHANLAAWRAELDWLASLPFRVLVPSHGPIAADAAPIHQTRDYLSWLDRTLHEAASKGLAMAEVLFLPVPARFDRLAVLEAEFERSVNHLYPALEAHDWPLVGRREN